MHSDNYDSTQSRPFLGYLNANQVTPGPAARTGSIGSLYLNTSPYTDATNSSHGESAAVNSFRHGKPVAIVQCFNYLALSKSYCKFGISLE
ncbi:hypothetical protein Ciccas_005043 [Cichlidogyrus casuarinus]|uniref:Uncharacterized protein n=1 Tax=Cichlidogyrus casuarinus TaxID=1844966 RepID=A0ABD2QAQ1_9PLAT